jgi:pantothenate kinase
VVAIERTIGARPILGAGPDRHTVNLTWHSRLRGRRQDMDNGTRDEMLSHVAQAVGSVKNTHPTRVAIDGPPAAGKTTLADELALVLRAQGRHVIRGSIESFLFPRSQRYRRGE